MQPNSPAAPLAPPPADPFRFGWRFVRKQTADGAEELEQVPLTLEDVLHPQEGDVIPQRSIHELDCAYLASVFRSRPLAPPVGWVSCDLLIDWGVPGLRPHSPDVAVFAGLKREPDLEKGTLKLAELGGRCLLVVEVVSPDTRNNDVVIKVGHYHRAGVPLYVLVDQEAEGRPRRVVAYRHTPAGYAEADLDELGRILLAPLGLLLGLRDNRAACFDAASGRELGDYSRISQELDEADRRIQEQERAIEDAVQARRDAERQARQDREAREGAERQARQDREARDGAERQARQDREAREDAERKAREERENFARQIEQLQAALRAAQSTPPPGG